jgi:hypothetical protein
VPVTGNVAIRCKIKLNRESVAGQGQLYTITKPSSGEWLDEEFDAIKAYGILRVVSLLEV